MRVFIDPGHGGFDPGAFFNGLIEKEIVLEIASRLADSLKRAGHLVEMSRSTDLFLDLFQRAQKANKWLADIFVSVHLNADPDPDELWMPEAKGSEFWIYPGSELGLKLAGTICVQIGVFFPDRRCRGIKDGNFAVLRLTKMPAVLLELAFIDTVESERLRDPDVQARLVAAVSNGICDYFNPTQGVV